MGIRAKLFVWIGSLIVLLGVLMFVFPKYFIKQDISEAAERVKGLIHKEHEEIEKNHQALIKEKVEKLEADVNAILFLINQFQTLSAQANGANTTPSLWKKAAQLLAYNPEVEFVQIHYPEKKQAASIVAYQTPLYLARSTPLSNNLGIVVLHALDEASTPNMNYIGITLPIKDKKGIFYALVDWQAASIELKDTLKALNATFPLFQQEPSSSSLAHEELETKNMELRQEFRWADQVEMINFLAPIYGEGIELFPNSKMIIPAGIAHVNEKGDGWALFSHDVFRKEPVFDDVTYFSQHANKSESSSLAQGTALIVDPQTKLVFLGNTLKLENMFVTLGSAFAHMARELALASSRTVLYSYREQDWKGFSSDGTAIDLQTIQQISSQTEEFNKTKGSINLGENAYLFTRFAPLTGQEIYFYILTPQEQEKSIVGTLFQLNAELTAKISSQLLVLLVILLIVTLVILDRIAVSITRPISQLAEATQPISTGKYEDVHLPKMGTREDEIAVLTRGFEQMVSGLKEREKIRAVLDKVVSKDVAEEILKTAIHLGGEDRIVTMLFSDIRDFTKITENLPPQQTIGMLNTYMTKMSRVIEGEGGVIDKYVGDEIMALYGAPSSHPDHAIRSISAAKLMIETLKKWNEERKKEGEIPIEMGIGIHTGLVVAGNMGAEDRLNYTVLGSNVNLAARLCQAAAPMQIIISESTLAEPNVKDSFYVKPLQPIALKGFSELIKIYEVVDFKWTSE